MSSRAERKFEQYEYAEPEGHANPKVKAAIEELLLHHTEVKQMPQPSQLKLSAWVSYYPTTRTIFIDGEQAKRTNMSIPDVVALLKERDELHEPRQRPEPGDCHLSFVRNDND
ncbi:hypothetical protein [Pontixanthobacter aquaemixtae]|uniref:Uncharacterized protein n=1 Tax=Pontixanthobacter aquaemixtae TaxID=1958940 RepID=A0A844ZU59_9SPHN|nr:hypothetical protein [Pontixanthobacter aquaemixtae]MXO91503.1 hypothetical protein [Pontixanthobacter aquaemixtae]